MSASTYPDSLAPRLNESESLSLATCIEDTKHVRADPRMDTALLLELYSTPAHKIVVAWADGSLGFAFFRPGQPLADSLGDAYRVARDALEALHLQVSAPDGVHH